MRYALYFTPSPGHELTAAAARWLGRDAFTGTALPAPDIDGLSQAEIAFHTAAPRRYGFHATLKAPFTLAPGETEGTLLAALRTFCKAMPSFPLALEVGQLDGFFALVPARRSPELHAFADSVVEAFHRFRAPLGDADIARRNPDALSPQEVSNLMRWGYPYVFDCFRFHMTLTGRVAPAEAGRIRHALDGIFAPLLRQPVAIDGLGLFVEPEPGAPFEVHTYLPLATGVERKTA